MPTWLAIVLIALLTLVVALAIGGALATGRRRRAGEHTMRTELAEADRALAAARAGDRGWDPEAMEATARAALVDFAIAELHLVQVVDKPGAEHDQARFRATAAEGDTREVTLGRTGEGAWVAL